MIVRELNNGIIVKIEGVSDDNDFMSKNPTGGFFKVDSLPPSSSQQWVRVDGEIVSNQEADDVIAANMYKDARKAEYPDFAEYLDGIVKGDQAQIDKYIADCQAVKTKYPKE